MKISDVAFSNLNSTPDNDWGFINYLDTGSCTLNEISNIQTIEKGSYPSRAKRVVQKDDVIISTVRPNQCHYAILKEPVENMIVSTGFTVLTPKKNIVPEYLYFFLTQKEITKRLCVIADGATTSYPSINPEDILNLDIALPAKPYQQKIADILWGIEQKISLNNKINSELEAMAKTIYNYWFVQFDFPFDFAQGKPNEEGKPYKTSGGEMEWNEELKREIPKDWACGKLSEVANIIMGQSPSGDSYNEEGEGMVFYQGSTDFNFRFPLVRMFTTEPSRIASEEDILLSVRAPVGTINVANEKCCIGRGLAALHSKFEANSYLLYLMFYFKAMFDVQNRTGTTFGSIDKDTLYDLKFAKPPVELQRQFQSIVGKYDKMILIRSRENQELIRLRDFLLPLLMNGQVKVR